MNIDKLNADLAGAEVQEIAVGNDEERSLRITTNRGAVYISMEGDCCSESWWADIVGAKTAIGAKIFALRAVEEGRDAPDGDPRTRQEYDRVYSYELDTTKGTVQLIFRNSSNGYYGGWASQEDAPCKEGYRPIHTDNWQATSPARPTERGGEE